MPEPTPPDLDLSEGTDLDERLPCPDGNCLGVAGPDGRCTECGVFIGVPEVREEGDPGGGEEGDPGGGEDERFPCPDGACIGVIGPDGRCTECGSSTSASGDREEEEEDEAELAGGDGGFFDDGDDERVPCSDGACIGIIGDDGRCTECGRAIDAEEG